MASRTNISSLGPTEIVTPTPTTTADTTEAPETTVAPTTSETGTDGTTTDGEGAEGPTMKVTVDYEGDELDEYDSATLEAEVLDAAGEPVEGAQVSFMSLGYGGTWDPASTVPTKSDGVATTEFTLDVPSSAFDKEAMPPAASLTMAASTEVNGETVEAVLNFPVRTDCEECHEEGEYD